MGHTISRAELYDQIWSTPITKLAPKFSVSDVAVSKACRKANIPIPPRGYWAKVAAGKPVDKPALPPRFPGAASMVRIGYRDQYSYGNHPSDDHILNNPLPPRPIFSEDIDSLKVRITSMIGKVNYPLLRNRTHPIIEKLLEIDSELEASSYNWEKPAYSSKTDKRRLRLINAIFLATCNIGCKASMSTSKYHTVDRDAYLKIGEHSVGFKLEEISTRSRRKKGLLRLSIINFYGQNNDISWKDSDGLPLEKFLTEISTRIVLEGELRHRYQLQKQHEWLIERKEELKERIRQEKIENERKAREQKEKLEKERIDRLLVEAQSLQNAEIIRKYVSTILSQSDEIDAPIKAIEKWASWALSQADRIDPIINLSFIKDCTIKDT